MSTPGNEFREAEYLGLGFLAVSSSELLERLLAHQPIDDDDRYTLQRARGFLLDVASGARLVTEGVSSNASATETVRKLAYSVEPLKLMQDEIRSAEVGSVFENMARSIEVSLDIDPAPKEEDLKNLGIAKDFFAQLHAFLVNLIEAGKRRTGSDLGLRVSLMDYA